MSGEFINLVGTSAVVAAIVGGLVTYLSQTRLLARKAELDYEFELVRDYLRLLVHFVSSLCWQLGT